ncbi:acyl transferase domain-containing protein [Calycina marina]|uniref:Acyl transferase domain-containing protein n=1 Tax=Calycina marina TaxID=1763456 RepID=A0A9P7YVU7_9HELO|nr:acyl transferase domain-containing protein [Calycina marina]
MSSASADSFASYTPFTTPCASPPQTYRSSIVSSVIESVKLGALKFSFRIPAALHIRTSQLIDQYLTYITATQAEPRTLLSLIVKFIRFNVDANRHRPDTDILSILIEVFEQRYLFQDDVHCLDTHEDLTLVDEDVVGIYYQACALTRRDPDARAPALLRAADNGSVSIYTIFGGQGSTSTFFEDLRQLHTTYATLVADYLNSTAELLCNLSRDKSCQGMFSQEIDILKWLRQPESTPTPELLVSSPYSFPLIGLLQLLNYMVALKVVGETPKDFQGHLNGSSGHSQGIFSAVAAAAADSWESYHRISCSVLTTLFWIGVRSQQAYPETLLAQDLVRDSSVHGEGVPTPMLSVREMSQSHLQKQIDSANKHFSSSEQVFIALVNNSQNFVVAGPPKSLYGLSANLRQLKPAPEENQSKVVYSKRRPNFSHNFLPITAPFHSAYLEAATSIILQDVRDHEILGCSLQIPVYDPSTGADLGSSAGNIIPEMVRMVTEKVVNWPSVTKKFSNATHLLEFGPGGPSGIGMLTSRNMNGRGVRVILADRTQGTNTTIGYRPELLSRHEDNIVYGCDWQATFAPRVVQTSAGELVDTKLSRVLGLPPYIIGGMTPTTAAWDFVATAMNAGYHIELAAGGYHKSEDLEEALLKLENAIPIGRGITVNVIYASPQAIAWQIPLLAKLRSQGVPIDGLTIGAGVPSPDVAENYINSVGLKHISFKPGSVAGIEAVIDIAKAYPAFPVILQWTGGRAGGHHSCEDFHQPILSTYGAIRQYPNIILVAGSGFGGSDDTYPYMTGDWSLFYGQPKMPFDGCLFGSRLMVAKEAHTSLAAKLAIVNTPGLPDHQWEQTCNGANGAGGIITVISEMGELIHMLATRGAKLWFEMDQKIFKLPPSLRVEALQKNRSWIIAKLNADFQRVWFGQDADGHCVDLEDMTYGEVLRRVVELLMVKRRDTWDWINDSYEAFTLDFIRRIEERFSKSKTYTILKINKSEDARQQILDLVLGDYPKARDQLITHQDAQYFLQLCQRRGQKPVPFIPTLDENFQTYFKKDSLWHSEDLDAVLDQDVQRICILHGPVAAKYSIRVDESVQTIMDGIKNGHLARLIADVHSGESDIPHNANLSWTRRGNKASTLDALSKFHKWTITETAHKHIYRVPSARADLPATESWLHLLAGLEGNWREVLFLTATVMNGRRYQSNPIRDVFAPAPGQLVEISNPSHPYNGSVALKTRCSERGEYITVASVEFWGKLNKVLLCLWNRPSPSSKSVALPIRFTFDPSIGNNPIANIVDDRKERIRNFYWQTWFDSPYNANMDPSRVFSRQSLVTAESIQSFAKSVGYRGESVIARDGQPIIAPIDYSIVVAWKAITEPLFCASFDGNLVDLVHLSNEFRMIPGASPLVVGDTVQTTSRVTAVVNQDSGRMVEVSGTIMRQNVPVIEVISRFLFRGKYQDYDGTFKHEQEIPRAIKLVGVKDLAVLTSKPWVHLEVDELEPNQTLEFRLRTSSYFNGKLRFQLISTTGDILLQRSSQLPLRIGSIKYEAVSVSYNEVLGFLDRVGSHIDQPILLKNPIIINESGEDHVLIAPASNEPYATASGDTNPIHISPVFAKYVKLPGTITHGMWTSAAVRSLLETIDDHAGRVCSWKANFVGMVLPDDKLHVVFTHTAMIGGRKLIRAEARNAESNDLVLTGEAEVDQPASTYIFTGQGSQRKGMGMELRDSSAVARAVWDRADAYFEKTYGFNITNIVKNDPKQLTVHFGGPKGKKIRQNYMSLTQDTTLPNGSIATTRLLPEITPRSTSHTFRSPIGLLSATQFTQPALTLMEIALFSDLSSKGLIAPNASFAGHSLGEYAALAALGGGILPIEVPVAITFFRGLAMQLHVERDAQGRSAYSMCALNPSKLPCCTEVTLRRMVARIGTHTGWLLEIVNFNIRDLQYICAGETRALSLLTDLANYLVSESISPASLDDDAFTALISRLALATEAKPQPLDYERGPATVPLKQIDVPFHSSFLEKNVASYRTFLRDMIQKEKVDVEKLVAKWIPNITGKPFGISKADFMELEEVTGSRKISEVLARWEEFDARRAA